MTRHILCSVDLTHIENAKSILLESDRLAGLYGATLSVMTVLPDYGSSWVGSFFKDGTLREASAAADTALHELVSETLPDRDQVQHIVEIGVVYEEVLKMIPKCGADLVIVGAHKPDMADKLLGPNAARVARLAPVSTLVLRLE